MMSPTNLWNRREIDYNGESLNQKKKTDFPKNALTIYSSEKEDFKIKGKHAYSTENRRLVWKYIIWPLVLQLNRQFFTLQEYHIKRDEFSRIYNISTARLSAGLISLV